MKYTVLVTYKAGTYKFGEEPSFKEVAKFRLESDATRWAATYEKSLPKEDSIQVWENWGRKANRNSVSCRAL